MKLLKSIILTVVLFLGFIWWQSFDTKRKSDDAIQMAVAIVKSVPEYGQNQAFFDAKLPGFHERAFGLALKRGRLKSSFSESIYRDILLKQFMRDAEAAGNTEVFEAMQRELEEMEQ